MTRECQNCNKEFLIEDEDLTFYCKIQVPPTTWCVECREQRRLAVRNERSLYKRNCDLCGKSIVSRFSPDKTLPVYCRDCWWSDKWNAKDYGRDYDFGKPFFVQFRDLLLSVPHVSLISANSVDSDWVNQETDDKNCYLNFGGHFNENSAYNIFELYGRDSFDNYWLLRSELCYECINCENCYRTVFSQDCFECQDAAFSVDCRNCSDVFGCAGLRNKKYCVFNRQLSKEDYEKFVKDNPFTHSSLPKLEAQAKEIWSAVPRKDRLMLKTVNSSGHVLYESKNAKNCWWGEKVEDCKNAYISADIKDSQDVSMLGWSELCYEVGHAMGLYNSKFSAYTIMSGEGGNSSNLEYCFGTWSSSNCFGCVNLSKAEYCILNEQYTKKEYEKLRAEIVEQMEKMPYVDKAGRVYKYGEFFPPEISPYAYNETVAQDWFPLTKQEAERKGYAWREADDSGQRAFSGYVIPDGVSEVKDDILQRALKCEVSGRPYRIIPMELQFYRRLGLPIPRRAPDERLREKIQRLLPMKLFKRECGCGGEKSRNGGYANTVSHLHGLEPCPNAIETPYAPERPEIVYCEQCYNAEVV